MLPPQQGRDDSLRARLAQGREANLPKPINAWGTGRDDAIKGNGNDSTFPLPRGTEGSNPSSSAAESVSAGSRGRCRVKVAALAPSGPGLGREKGTSWLRTDLVSESESYRLYYALTDCRA